MDFVLRVSLILLGATVLLGSAGCRSRTAPSDTLVYARGTDADSLDPLDTSLGESVKVISNVYDTLVTYDEQSLDLVPSLAESWEVADDRRVWTFSLREGVRFHDGTPLDAAAVVFNFERMLQTNHPHLYGARRPYQPHYTMIERVEAVDGHTVRFHLHAPSAVFLNNLAMFPASIVSPAAIKKYQRRIGEQPVGTGPFELDSWQRDQRLVLRRFEEHWRGAPRLERVIFIPVAENAIRAKQLLRGEIHMTDDLPPAEMDVLAESPEIEVLEQQGLNVGYLSVQMQKPPLNDPRVRQAIWHAIDKQRLVDVAYSGHAKTAVSLVPPNLWGHHNQLQDRAFAPERAKELLQEAADDLGLSLPVELDLYFMKQPRPYMQQPRQVAVFIRDALKPIGIDVNLIANDYRQHFQRLSAGEHDLGLAGWVSDNTDPDNFLFSLLDKTNIDDQGGNNLSRYESEEVHRLLQEGQAELAQERRAALYRQVQQIAFDDVPVIPLVHIDIQVAQREEVEGYYLHPTGLVRLRLAHFRKADR